MDQSELQKTRGSIYRRKNSPAGATDGSRRCNHFRRKRHCSGKNRSAPSCGECGGGTPGPNRRCAHIENKEFRVIVPLPSGISLDEIKTATNELNSCSRGR